MKPADSSSECDEDGSHKATKSNVNAVRTHDTRLKLRGPIANGSRNSFAIRSSRVSRAEKHPFPRLAPPRIKLLFGPVQGLGNNVDSARNYLCKFVKKKDAFLRIFSL